MFFYCSGCITAFLMLMTNEKIDRQFGSGINRDFNGQQKVLILSIMCMLSWLGVLMIIMDDSIK